MADKYYIQEFTVYRIVESQSSTVIATCTHPGEAQLTKNALNEGAPYLICQCESQHLKIEGNLITCLNCSKSWQKPIAPKTFFEWIKSFKPSEKSK